MMLRTGVLVFLMFNYVTYGTSALTPPDHSPGLDSPGPGVNPLNTCRENRRILGSEKLKCLKSYIQSQWLNNTGSSATWKCKTFKDVEHKFNETNSKLVDICGWESNTTKLVVTSMKLRLKIIEEILEQDKLREFFGNNGLQCVQKTGKIIFDQCIKNYMANVSLSNTKISLIRLKPLRIYSEISLSLHEIIANCTRNVLEKHKCSSSSIDYIMSCHDIISNMSKSAINTVTQSQIMTKRGSGGTVTAIIIGTLAGLVLLLALGMCFARKNCSCTKKQDRSYSVAYDARDAVKIGDGQ